MTQLLTAEFNKPKNGNVLNCLLNSSLVPKLTKEFVRPLPPLSITESFFLFCQNRNFFFHNVTFGLYKCMMQGAKSYDVPVQRP
jgi:hypothetical protein